jgi:ribonuclease HII
MQVPKVLRTTIELKAIKDSKIFINHYKNELKPEIKHSACSASIMFPETRMDMVQLESFNMYGQSPEVFVNF